MVGPVRFGLFPVTGTNEQMWAKAPFRGDYKLAGVQISRRALSPILVLRVHTVHRVCASPSHESSLLFGIGETYVLLSESGLS